MYLAHLNDRLREGLIVGLAFAALYCAYALVLFAVGGSAPFAKHGVTLPLVLATYLTSGAAGGIAYGVLHPFGRTLFGRAVLGVLIATLVFFAITIATDGLPSRWSRDSWEKVAIAGGLLGTPIGLLWRRVIGP